MMSSVSSVTSFGILGSAFTTSDFRQNNVGTLSTEALFSMSEPDQLDVWGARIAESGKTNPNSQVFSHELNMEVLQGHCQGEPALSTDLVLLGRQLIGVIWPLQEISDGLSQE